MSTNEIVNRFGPAMHIESRDAPAFDQLPTELVADIFVLVVAFPSDGDPEYDADNVQEVRGEISPLLLCKVCQRWRSIAFSTPLLWARIWIKFKKPLSGGYERRLLKQWLDRAGTCPLSLTIFGSLYDKIRFKDEAARERNELLVADMTEMVISALPRCRALYTCLFRTYDVGGLLVEKILCSIPDGMPLLEKIHWHTTYNPSNCVAPIDISSCTALRILEGPLIFPRLRSVSGGVSVPINPFRFDKVDLPHLQRLRTTGSMSGLCQVLVRSRDVKKCVYNIRSVTNDPETDDIHRLLSSHPVEAPVMFRGLELLHLRIPSDALSTEPLWDQICFPSLKSFNVDIHEGPNPLDTARIWRSFYSCLERSRPPLEHFVSSLSCITTEALQLVVMLSWMPTLKTLDLGLRCADSVVNETLWRALRGEHLLTDSQEFGDNLGGAGLLDLSGVVLPICPRLEKLSVSTSVAQSLPYLAETATSRFPSSTGDTGGMRIPSDSDGSTDTNDRFSLQKLTVHKCGFTEDELLNYPGIDRCVQAGLSVYVSSGYLRMERK